MEDNEDLNLNHKKFSPKNPPVSNKLVVFFGLNFISAEVYRRVKSKNVLKLVYGYP
jgi:hypothetical protein